MTHRYLPFARLDLDELAEWFDARQAGLGDDFVSEVVATVGRIAAQPRLYPRVGRGVRGREIREALTGRFPVLLVYEVRAAEIVILSLTHGRSVRRTWRRRLPDPEVSDE